MAQIKTYGLKANIVQRRNAISKAIHEAVMTALKYPLEKKFHRFIPIEKEDFFYPNDRSEKYIIIEITMFEGRSIEAKKLLIHELYSKSVPNISLLQAVIVHQLQNSTLLNYLGRGYSLVNLNDNV